MSYWFPHNLSKRCSSWTWFDIPLDQQSIIWPSNIGTHHLRVNLSSFKSTRSIFECLLRIYGLSPVCSKNCISRLEWSCSYQCSSPLLRAKYIPLKNSIVYGNIRGLVQLLPGALSYLYYSFIAFYSQHQG